jgi:TonB family protein
MTLVLFCLSGEARGQGAGNAPPADQNPGKGDSTQPTGPGEKPVVHVAGNVMAAKIVRQVAPKYPSDAKKKRIQGTVKMHAIITKDGKIRDLKYISGPPELMDSALDAVRQWRYEPTLLEGKPVEVDTIISVMFTLN